MCICVCVQVIAARKAADQAAVAGFDADLRTVLLEIAVENGVVVHHGGMVGDKAPPLPVFRTPCPQDG